MTQGRYYILNAAGDPEPCDWETWARWFETADRRVCQDYDEGDPEKRILVSTVFLGLDHGFGDSGPPVLWETMVFAGHLPELHHYGRRYRSKDAAILGHQDTCELVTRAVRAAQAQEPHQ